MATGGRLGVESAAPSTTVRIFRWGALALIAAVLVQAFLGGRGFFLADDDMLTVHGRVGDALLLVAIAHVVVGAVAFRRRQLSRVPLGLSVVLLVLVFVQLSLGYGSEDSRSAAAWHLPTGVLIFGLAVANAFLSGAVAWAPPGPPGGAR